MRGVQTLFFIVAFCVVLTSGFTEAASANVIYAASPAYEDVNAAILSARPGDTVKIPSGSATWANQLVITKGIQLTGAGLGLTRITSNYSGNWLISYKPSDFSANWPLRISGFTFDFAKKCGGIILNYSSSDLTVQTKVRIDHNEFKNASTQALMINGYRGVADNNIFTGTAYPIRFASGQDQMWWNNWEGIVFGKPDNNFYFEDNTFEVDSVLVDCQYGNRYAFRYNTIKALNPSGSYPLMDMHGNQGAGYMYACFGGEIYGNDITVQGDGGQILDQRGGKTVVFYNRINGKNFGIKLREEYCDDLNPTDNEQPQHVSDSYNWANWKTSPEAIVTGYESQNSCSSYSIKENQDWWNYTTSFDGTSGVGCGPIRSRPQTCSRGVAYWATEQSCSDLTGLTGVHPTTPISGTLYKCTAPNTWTAYYTPYPYPHPLRGEGGATLSPPTLKLVQ